MDKKERSLYEDAEEIIYRQNQRIDYLRNEISRAEEQKHNVKTWNNNMLEPFLEENKRLNINLDTANAEIAALNNQNQKSEKFILDLKANIAVLEGVNKDKRLIIQDLKRKLETSPKKLDELKGEILSYKNFQLKPLKFISDHKLCSFKRNIESYILTETRNVGKYGDEFKEALEALKNVNEEIDVSRKCLVRLESELLAFNNIIKAQEQEIEQLLSAIDIMNNEKALKPPIFYALPNIKHSKTSDASFNVAHNVANTLPLTQSTYMPKKPAILAAQNKIMKRNKALIEILLNRLNLLATYEMRKYEKSLENWDNNKGIYYENAVMHAINDTTGEYPTVFNSRQMAIKIQHIYLWNKLEKEESMIVLHAHKVRNVEVDKINYEIRLDYSFDMKNSKETHIIKVNDSDEVEKWRYAMMYAGFLPKLSGYLSRNVHCTPALLTVDLFVSSGTNPDKSPNYEEQLNTTLKYDEKRHQIILKNENNKEGIKIPCEKCLYKCNLEKNEIMIYFDVTVSDPKNYKILARNEEDFLLIVNFLKKPSSIEEKSVSYSRSSSTLTSYNEEDSLQHEDNYLTVLENSGKNRKPLLQLKNEDCITKINREKKEITIVHNPSTIDEEIYVFNFDNNEDFERWMKLLELKKFLDMKNIQIFKMQDVIVITKDRLILYRNYNINDSDCIPEIILKVNRCSAIINEKNNLVNITYTDKNESNKFIDLVCSSEIELMRWVLALMFANILSERNTKFVMIKQIRDNLSKFIFPVNFFPDSQMTYTALRVDNEKICLFPHPESVEPIMIIPKNVCQMLIFEKKKMFRFFINRHTKIEEVVDFKISLASIFNSLYLELLKFKYNFVNSVNAENKSLKMPYVMSKSGIIAIYKNKFFKNTHKKELEILVSNYTCNVCEFDLSLKFRSRRSTPDTMKALKKIFVKCMSNESFRRWILSLKFSGFLPISDKKFPHFYFPFVIYGHVNDDVPELVRHKLYCKTLLKKNKKYIRKSSEPILNSSKLFVHNNAYKNSKNLEAIKRSLTTSNSIKEMLVENQKALNQNSGMQEYKTELDSIDILSSKGNANDELKGKEIPKPSILTESKHFSIQSDNESAVNKKLDYCRITRKLQNIFQKRLFWQKIRLEKNIFSKNKDNELPVICENESQKKFDEFCSNSSINIMKSFMSNKKCTDYNKRIKIFNKYFNKADIKPCFIDPLNFCNSNNSLFYSMLGDKSNDNHNQIFQHSSVAQKANPFGANIKTWQSIKPAVFLQRVKYLTNFFFKKISFSAIATDHGKNHFLNHMECNNIFLNNHIIDIKNFKEIEETSKNQFCQQAQDKKILRDQFIFKSEVRNLDSDLPIQAEEEEAELDIEELCKYSEDKEAEI